MTILLSEMPDMNLKLHPPIIRKSGISKSLKAKTEKTKPKIERLGKICGISTRSLTSKLAESQTDKTNPMAIWVKYSEKDDDKDKTKKPGLREIPRRRIARTKPQRQGSGNIWHPIPTPIRTESGDSKTDKTNPPTIWAKSSRYDNHDGRIEVADSSPGGCNHETTFIRRMVPDRLARAGLLLVGARPR